MTDPESILLRQQILEAGVRQSGHVVLSSGRHSDVKLDMEKLLEPRNRMRLRVVTHALGRLIGEIEYHYDAVVPVPNGMLNILAAAEAETPGSLPRIIPSSKRGKRNFTFSHPAAKALLKRASRLAVVDDVLTTGGNPLAMAVAIRGHNPEVPLDLFAVWRRDTLEPAVNDTFEHQAFVIEERIPSWPAEECTCLL